MEAEEGAARTLQAHIRGFLVRKKLHSVHQEYLEVVREIEGEDVVVYPGKWLLSLPHFTTLDKRKETKPHKLENNGYSHSKLSRISEKSIELHKETALHTTSGGRETLDSLQVEKTETNVSCSDTERPVNWAETCLPHSKEQTKDNFISTLSPEKDTYFIPGTKAEVDHVILERDSYSLETDCPVEETSNAEIVLDSHTEPDGPVQECSHKETDGPVKETDIQMKEGSYQYVRNIEDLMVLKNHSGKELLSPDPEIEPCLPESALNAYHSQELRRNSSLWSEENLNIEHTMKTVSELRKHRSHLAMEILWVQQAIASRKNYLMVRQRLGVGD